MKITSVYEVTVSGERSGDYTVLFTFCPALSHIDSAITNEIGKLKGAIEAFESDPLDGYEEERLGEQMTDLKRLLEAVRYASIESYNLACSEGSLTELNHPVILAGVQVATIFIKAMPAWGAK